jgi:hypothetical protein
MYRQPGEVNVEVVASNQVSSLVGYIIADVAEHIVSEYACS